MSTLAVTNTLASVLVPIGNIGAVIAVACALLTAFALVRGAAGLAGGGVGVWLLGALLSLCASFAMLWTPFLVSVGALVAAFVVGAIGRALLRAARRARASSAAAAPAAVTSAAAVPVVAASTEAPTPATKSSPRAPARSVPARTITDSIRIAS